MFRECSAARAVRTCLAICLITGTEKKEGFLR